MFEPYYFDDMVRDFRFWVDAVVIPVLILLAAVAVLVKLRGWFARTAAFLGFLVLGLVALFWGLVSLGTIDPYSLTPEIVAVLYYSSWAAWVFIVVGLLTTSTRRFREGDTYPAYDGFEGYGAPAAPGHDAVGHGVVERPSGSYGTDGPLQRPGWALATWWIVLSTLSWITGAIWLLMFIDAQPRVSSREWEEMAPVLVVYLLLLIPAAILYCVWLHKAWSAVPARFRSASPGQAVGFLFIPFFNLYWVFRAIPGLSASVRRTLEASTSQRASGAGYGLGITACVVALIPYVNQLSWVFFLIWLCVANSEKNRMLRVLAARRQAPQA